VTVIGAVLADVLVKSSIGLASASSLEEVVEVSDDSQGPPLPSECWEETPSIREEGGDFSCGCLAHLRHLPLGPRNPPGARCVHVGSLPFLLGRDPRRVPPEGLLLEEQPPVEKIPPVISRLHAELCSLEEGSELEEPQICLRDLGSTNGTFVLRCGR
ncbi:unnamed protein product, partial [Polarella glacialis]